MPGPSRLPRSEWEQIARLRRDVNELQFRLDHAKQVPPVEATAGAWVLIFSMPDTPNLGLASPPFYGKDPLNLVAARISAATAGGGDFSVDVNVDGSLFTTLTLPSAGNTLTIPLTLSKSPDVPLELVVADVNGQENVSVEFYQ